MFVSRNVVLHVSRGFMKLSKRLMALLLGCSALGIAVRTPSQDLGACQWSRNNSNEWAMPLSVTRLT